jgi:xanthine dehydrogenase accessory factor
LGRGSNGGLGPTLNPHPSLPPARGKEQVAAQLWLEHSRAAVVVEVLSTQGSVPREAGTRMLVAADEVLGTIGGGHLELLAINQARDMLARGQSTAQEQHFALGPTLGQCCGGALTLRLSPLATQDPASWPAAPPRFHLQLYGAGHVGRAIARLLAGIHCRVTWIDEREDQFPGEALPAHITNVCVEPVEAEVATAPPGAMYLVLTHSHDLDMAICEAILRRGDFAFAGLIGSKTKAARFRHRFEARGLDARVINRLVCPIGLSGITGKEPEVIAVAVVAQLLSLAPPR